MRYFPLKGIRDNYVRHNYCDPFQANEDVPHLPCIPARSDGTKYMEIKDVYCGRRDIFRLKYRKSETVPFKKSPIL